MEAPPGFRGSLPEVENRIKELATQRAAVEAKLEAMLASDEERAARDAESQALRDAFNRLHVKL
jgi:hypothetical protein